MLISFVWLYMIKCDVYAQLLIDQTQKYFWVFYMFLKVFLYFYVLSFCSKCIFVLFYKNFFRGIFARSSRLSSSHEDGLRQNMKIQNSDRDFHDSLATVSRVKSIHEKFCALDAFFASNLWKTHVFNFKELMWQIFKYILFSVTLPPSCLSQPKTLFH